MSTYTAPFARTSASGLASADAGASRSRLGTVALWVLQVGIAGMFLFAGSLKLSGAPEMVATFEALGLGQWFRYLTGGIEVVAALLLLTPRLAVAGAALLVPTMIGAIATHAVIGGSATPAVVLLLGTLIVVWARRGELRQFASTFVGR